MIAATRSLRRLTETPGPWWPGWWPSRCGFGVGVRFLRALRLYDDGLLGEVTPELALVLGAVLLGPLELGLGAVRKRAGDQAVVARAARRLDAERREHAPVRPVGVLAPVAVDREDGRRAEAHEMLVEVALQRGDERLVALGTRHRAAAEDHEIAALAHRLGGGAGNQPVRAHGAFGRDLQRGAHCAEHLIGLRVPLAIDHQQRRPTAADEVAVQITLQGRDVRVLALVLGQWSQQSARARVALAQLLLEAGAVLGGHGALGVGDRLGGAGDQPERSDVAFRREAEHAADLHERLLGVLVPFAIDGQPLHGAETAHVGIEVTLGGGDKRAVTLRLTERNAANHCGGRHDARRFHLTQPSACCRRMWR